MKSLLMILGFILFLSISVQVSSNRPDAGFSDKGELSFVPESKITPTPSPKNKSGGLKSKIGIVIVERGGAVCLKTDNRELAEKTPVTIVGGLFFPPQRIVTASVGKKLEANCDEGRAEQGTGFEDPVYYLLDMPVDDRSDVDLSFAVIDPPGPAKVRNGLVSVDIDDDGKAEYFRHCAGYEGTHLTVWTGKPLKGKRLWHTYFYLGYDTVADCRKADWKETN